MPPRTQSAETYSSATDDSGAQSHVERDRQPQPQPQQLTLDPRGHLARLDVAGFLPFDAAGIAADDAGWK